MKIASLFFSFALLGIGNASLQAAHGLPTSPATVSSSEGPVRFEHMNRDMVAVRKMYNEVYLPAHRFPQGWTEPGNCKPGTLSAATLDARKREINYFRKMAGLQPVELDPKMNHYAQAAAYLMYKNNALSHNPPTSWKCYSADAAKGAGSSNLGYGGGLDSYIHDYGDNNRSCGHRMWILKESSSTMGYGGTNGTDAVYVFGDTKTHDSLPRYVAWPPAGFCPAEIVSDRWSISVPGVSAKYANAKATVTLDGQVLPLEYTETTSYGDDGLVFEIKDWAKWQEKMLDKKVKVQVKGIEYEDKIATFSYEIVLFNATDQNVVAKLDEKYGGSGYSFSYDGYNQHDGAEEEEAEPVVETEPEKVVPFEEQPVQVMADLLGKAELNQLAVNQLKSTVVRDLVYDGAISKFATRLAALRKEKNPDAERLLAYAVGKIKAHLASKSNLSEDQAARMLEPKICLIEVKRLVKLNGQETYGQVAEELATEFAKNPDLKAFALKYKRARQCGVGLTAKTFVKGGVTYAGVYATLLLTPATLRAAS